jgi:hypothetical protein
LLHGDRKIDRSVKLKVLRLRVMPCRPEIYWLARGAISQRVLRVRFNAVLTKGQSLEPAEALYACASSA